MYGFADEMKYLHRFVSTGKYFEITKHCIEEWRKYKLNISTSLTTISHQNLHKCTEKKSTYSRIWVNQSIILPLSMSADP